MRRFKKGEWYFLHDFFRGGHLSKRPINRLIRGRIIGIVQFKNNEKDVFVTSKAFIPEFDENFLRIHFDYIGRKATAKEVRKWKLEVLMKMI